VGEGGGGAGGGRWRDQGWVAVAVPFGTGWNAWRLSHKANPDWGGWVRVYMSMGYTRGWGGGWDLRTGWWEGGGWVLGGGVVWV